MSMTTVQDPSALYVKDVKVMWAPYQETPTIASVKGASWVDLGALTEAGRESNVAFETPASLNVKHNKVNTTTEINLNLTLQEISRANRIRLSGGLFKQADVLAAEVVGATQDIEIGYTYGKFIKLENQNADGSANVITSIVQDPGGADTPLVLDTDYFKIFNDKGEYGIYIIDSVTADNTIATRITYNYTPAEIKRTLMTETNMINPFMLRFVSTMSDGRTLDDFYPRVEFTGGLETTDKNYDASEFKDMTWSGVAQLHDELFFDGAKVPYFRDEYTI